MLFKNGEKEGFKGAGMCDSGIILIISSEVLVPDKFSYLLDEATAKLQLNNAARRLFTMEGEEIFSVEYALIRSCDTVSHTGLQSGAR